MFDDENLVSCAGPVPVMALAEQTGLSTGSVSPTICAWSRLVSGSTGHPVLGWVRVQESGLRNLDHGDRDSQGLFQQRHSPSWGSVQQVLIRPCPRGVLRRRRPARNPVLIFEATICSVDRDAQGWRAYRPGYTTSLNDSSLHRNHVHVTLYGNSTTGLQATEGGGTTVGAGE